MKGIILAGGMGTRLYPLTRATSKQLLPVYNKPLIYYPLSVLMLAGIRDILVISTPADLPVMKGLLGDGAELGISLRYAVQEAPNGIADAFLVGRDFGEGQPVCLVLGDNVFHGQDLVERLERASGLEAGATVFAIQVSNPALYGIVSFDERRRPLRIEEKPRNSASHWAVTGLYFYDARVYDFARTLRPSARGELEITDLNNLYLARGELRVERLSRGAAWFDAGNSDSLLAAGNYVQVLETRQGVMVSCLEEIAYRKGFIDRAGLARLAAGIPNSGLRKYLQDLLAEESAMEGVPGDL